MDINAKHISSFKSLIEKLDKKVQTGDQESSVKKAIAMVFYKYLLAGNNLSDLSLFKNTKYYTGKKSLDKAA